MNLLVLQILAVVLLMTLLFYLEDRQILRENRNVKWDGTAFDADEILHRVKVVRTNYVSVLHCQRRLHSRLHGLLARACRLVAGKSYFRRSPGSRASVVEENSDDHNST